MKKDLHHGDFTVKAKTGAAAIPRLYGEALLALARERDDIVCLDADLTPATETDLFRDAFPDRFYMVGIAEANMMGIAAGLARCGDTPFVHTFSVFATRRAYDQVAMQIAYPKTNVKIVGFLPGLTTLLGVSHQAIDDNALMRALPNMTVIEPANARQIAPAVRAALDYPGPVYLRMHRPSEAPGPDVAPLALDVGKGQVLRPGGACAVFASGLLVDEALKAAEALASEGLEIAVCNLHTLKPLDGDFVIEEARRCGAVVTAENHSVIGGLGSAVAETLMEAGVPVPFERVGVLDRFAEGGSTPYLFEKYGLDATAIMAAVKRCLARKR